jgi:hypothetical protein
MNHNWEPLQVSRAREKRNDIMKIFACILALTLIFGTVAYKVAKRHLAQVGSGVTQTEQASHFNNESEPKDGRVLLVGIVLLAVLSGIIAPAIGGGRYSYSYMVWVTLIVGALNLVAGQMLWKSNSPDPQDYDSMGASMCLTLAGLDFVVLLVIGAFSWAAKKDAQ